MASRCKVLDDNDPSSSYLDGTLHILKPTKISSIAASIAFDLINLLFSNTSYYIDSMSDEILTGGISYMGNLSSKITPHKISAAVIIQKSITL